ncbi:MAG: hypothetical protein CL807_08125 [Citromicrobium sp.]|nr:hypothetical protein [Citromicrobium sp.]MBD76837.1 hypothetical protein [Citromicrobium sp.]MBT47822.1 hypothetical protein [Citromicrobium sp.]|tara:strand:- start:703 stop:1083 length:381 start_codon:yes stop_codon:yes gene_type:complete
MPANQKISRFISFSPSRLKKYDKGIGINDLKIITGWSRATLYRRMNEIPAPAPLMKEPKVIWPCDEILDWVTRVNLRIHLGIQEALNEESVLEAQSENDLELRGRLGKAKRREQIYRGGFIFRNLV